METSFQTYKFLSNNKHKWTNCMQYDNRNNTIFVTMQNEYEYDKQKFGQDINEWKIKLCTDGSMKWMIHEYKCNTIDSTVDKT